MAMYVKAVRMGAGQTSGMDLLEIRRRDEEWRVRPVLPAAVRREGGSSSVTSEKRDRSCQAEAIVERREEDDSHGRRHTMGGAGAGRR